MTIKEFMRMVTSSYGQRRNIVYVIVFGEIFYNLWMTLTFVDDLDFRSIWQCAKTLAAVPKHMIRHLNCINVIIKLGENAHYQNTRFL